MGALDAGASNVNFSQARQSRAGANDGYSCYKATIPRGSTGRMQSEHPNVLSRTLLSALAARGDLRTYARNELLIVEGEVSDSLFILIDGQLKVFTQDAKGRELIYNILSPGEFFGEMFLDGGARSASVKAVVDSQCAVIDQSAIRDFMRTYPEFAEALVLKLIERLRHATRQIKSLGLDDVYERTINLINQVAECEAGVRFIPTTMTQQEIANRVGATREMVNHIIRGLVRGGFLAKDADRRVVVIKEPPKRW